VVALGDGSNARASIQCEIGWVHTSPYRVLRSPAVLNRWRLYAQNTTTFVWFANIADWIFWRDSSSRIGVLDCGLVDKPSCSALACTQVDLTAVL
jgi:hypothetical protein